MSKKSKRPPSAQNLIDSLLDDKPTAKPRAKPETPSAASNVGTGAAEAMRVASQETASIVIDLQERIDERSGLSKNSLKPEAREPSRKFELLDADLPSSPLVLSRPDVAKHLDPVAKAQAESRIEKPSLEDSSPTPVMKPGLPQMPAAAPPPPPQAKAPEKPIEKIEEQQDGEDERTVPINAPKKKASTERPSAQPIRPVVNASQAEASQVTVDRVVQTEIKTRAGTSGGERQKVAAPNYGSGNFGSPEAALKQSESLRIAQRRITDLEKELERVRRENENLATAGDTLRQQFDQLLSKLESLDAQKRESAKIHDEEKKVFRSQLNQKNRELMEMKGHVEELKVRLDNDFKKIRVTERDLRHRNDILKAEHAAVISSKDAMILSLKQKIDKLDMEKKRIETESKEQNDQIKKKEENGRRVVRALRIALTTLEGEEDPGDTDDSSNKPE